MTFHNLLRYIGKHPNTRTSVTLKQLAWDVQEQSGKKAELLCDFSVVVQWVLSGHDREQIQTGQLSPYTILYGGDLKAYGECILKFVKSLELVGIQPVFFAGGPPGSKQEDFEMKFEEYKQDSLWMQEMCANIEQICAGNRDLFQVKWILREPMSVQIQSVLRAAGVCMVCCPGEPVAEMVKYSKLHSQVLGVVTRSVDFVIVPGLKVLIPDLLSMTDATVRVLTEGECSVVSSGSLANAMGLKENQLPHLLKLCSCDGGVLTELGLDDGRVETIIQWLQDRDDEVSQLLDKYSNCKEVMAPIQFPSPPRPPPCEKKDEPDPELGSLERSEPEADDRVKALAEIVQDKVHRGTMMPHLLSIVEGHYWRSSAVELASLGHPCINDLTLSLRATLYSLMGLENVTEYGRTGTKTFDTIPVELNAQISSGMSQLKFLEERAQNERLSLLFDLIGNQLSYQDNSKLQERVSAACKVGSEITEPISSAAVVACGSLLFLYQSDQVISSFPQIKYFEFDALLITLLTCVAGFPVCVLPYRPPVRAVSISMYFSHILEQAYLVASYLGLQSELPAPANLFYSMAYVPYHLAALGHETPPHVEGPSLDKVRNQFCSLQDLKPVLALRAELMNRPNDPNLLPLLELFSSSVAAVASYKAQVEEEESVLPSLAVGGGFNLCAHKEPDLSSSVNSDSSIFVKCNELSATQDFQASEEDLYFTDMFDDVVASDIDEGDDDVFPICDMEHLDGIGITCHSYSNSGTLDLKMRLHVHVDDDVRSTDSIPDKVATPSSEEILLAEVKQWESGSGSIPEGALLDKSFSEPTVLDKTLTPVRSPVPCLSSHSCSFPPCEDQQEPSVMAPPPLCVNQQDPSVMLPPPPPHVNKQELPVVAPPPPPPHVEQRELPVMAHREVILELIRSHRVVCIEGETGCGKSTKIPQFILDDSLSSDPARPCKILVTQPRRVAVMKLAERVAAERKERIGQTVGYCIGGERHRTTETRLTYCTVGYLLHVSHSPNY